MNKSIFYQYLHYPELLDDRSLMDIEKIIAEYPYFQSAYLLNVKNLSNQGSIIYDRELKRSAVWVTNRKKLFHLLDNRNLLSVNDNKLYKTQQPQLIDNIEIIDFTELTEATSFSQEQNNKTTTDNDNELSQLIMMGSAQAASHFNVSDKVDLEDFKNTFRKNSDKNTTPSKKSDKKAHHKSLIDNFIIDQPKIIQKDGVTIENKPYTKDYSTNESSMITDTLAKIYIKQEKYEKAIVAYKKLSLKYPEKNSYFASQISKIEDLVNNK